LFVSADGPQPHEPSVAQLALAAAARRVRHHWKPATEPPITRQPMPISSLRVANQARIAEPMPAESSSGIKKGSVQHAAQATTPAMMGSEGREGAEGFTGLLREATTAACWTYGRKHTAA